MAKIERTYNIPLRTSFRNVPEYKRAKKAVNAVKRFIEQHMKSDKIKLGNNLNKKLWQNGIKNPPHHVKVTALKEDDGLVRVELFGFNVSEVALKPKKDEKPKKEEAAKKEEAQAEKPGKEEKSTEPKMEEQKQEAEGPKKEEKRNKAEEPKSAKPKKAPAKKTKKVE